jgi:CDP-glucose 4,6-dehydratase
MNILDRVKLLDLMREHKITSCLHLAGLTTVESGYENPAQMLATNIQGAVNILECARAVGLERVIIASSVHAYGSQPTPYLETSPLLPTRPYETSKACADMVAQSYAATFNLPVLIPRFVNTYGPGDTHTERLIPKTIHSLLHGQPPTLWGGSIQRDYLFIDDAIEAYVKLLQVDTATVGQNRAINIGTGQLTSVQEVMRIIARCMDVPFQVTTTAAERLGEIISQEVSITKAFNVLAWTPTVDLAAGLLRTVSWYTHQDKVRAKALSKT